MPAGLFGKLPAKRDFIGANASRRFLEIWEPWLQAGVAMSRQMLGDAWIEAYNRAPIWRYWLGADFCGEAMIGAFMPSVDGVGRSFPLAIFVGEGLASLPPPELDENGAWFEAAEAILLDALEPGATLEMIAEKVMGLPPPAFNLGRPRTRAWKNWPTARSSPATSALRFPPPFSPRGASGAGGLSRPRASGGRSAAKAFLRSHYPRSACRHRPASPIC